jgi:uracil DNA glycosylase
MDVKDIWEINRDTDIIIQWNSHMKREGVYQVRWGTWSSDKLSNFSKVKCLIRMLAYPPPLSSSSSSFFFFFYVMG